MPNTSIQAAGEAMPAPTNETPHDEVRRLSWRIADLLNGLDPRIDYVTICASGSEAHAVMTGFNIPVGNEASVDGLFREWQALRLSIIGEDTPEVEKQKLQQCEDLRQKISSLRPATLHDLVLMLYVHTVAGVNDYEDEFMTNVFSLVGLTNENVREGA